MKRVEDFNEFLSNHVNINQNRLDKLNDHVAAVTTPLEPASWMPSRKWSAKVSYALRTIIKPKGKSGIRRRHLALFMKYQPGKKSAEYINDAYDCLREHGTYRDMVHRKDPVCDGGLRRRLPLGHSSLCRDQRPTLHLQQQDQ